MQFQSATLVALAAANAAVEAGETRVVVALDATLDGKSASSLTLTVGKAHPGLDFFVLAQTPEDEDLVCFASVSAAGSDVDARLWVAAAMLPLGGKGGGKVDFAMGKAEKASQAALDEALELALAF
ncbi:hypothetical protein M885DRAFT_527368 [Pelagophyceae sp. CCMP2097]|nr:hypothetical protein M885DRAFT_527368 [Pelagophyceae sp. CCMP2097]|mmetsp:Transcript_5168/g.18294  ORF Transcript_5168/g.18294 Transcript_5168/m.18294 type:complete len:126 (-) Transcript_5168:177-554(-)